MAPTGEKVKVTVHEKEYLVELYVEKGKSYAKTHINNFGEVVVPDFGGGNEKALKNIQARIGNIVGTMQKDEERENRRLQWKLEQETKKEESKPAV